MLKFKSVITILLVNFVLLNYSLAEDISIGFPEFPNEFNLANPVTPAGMFLKQALSAALVASRDKSSSESFSFRVSDAYEVNEDFSHWTFHVKSGYLFSSGQEVSVDDVLFSIAWCREQGLLKLLRSHGTSLSSNSLTNDLRWVEFYLNKDTKLKERKLFPLELAQCPIVEKSSTRLFGEDFAYGTNVVSTGSYIISDFQKGKRITLQRTSASSKAAAPKRIVLRAFEDFERVWAAIRVGSIDVFFAYNQDVIQEAKKDETLLGSKCSIYYVVYRKDFHVECVPELKVDELIYVFR